jgi:hypothetical protein
MGQISVLSGECDCSACVFLLCSKPSAFVSFDPTLGKWSYEKTGCSLMEMLSKSEIKSKMKERELLPDGHGKEDSLCREHHEGRLWQCFHLDCLMN